MWLIVLIPLVQACGKIAQEAKSERNAEGPTAASGGAANQGQQGLVLRIPEERRKELGIRVEPVRMGPVPETITATAFIEPNANRMVHVTPRIPGKTIQVLADFGDMVKRGLLYPTIPILSGPGA